MKMKLRSLQLRDTPYMLEWMHDPEINKNFRFNAEDQTIETVQKFIEFAQSDNHNKHFAIADENDEYQGTVSLKDIDLDNLKYLIDNKRHIILRCPIIHKINDNMDHFQAISHYSKYVSSIEILPYHNLGKAKAENINLDSYFYQENTSEELKELWKKQLSELGCLNFKIH